MNANCLNYQPLVQLYQESCQINKEKRTLPHMIKWSVTECKKRLVDCVFSCQLQCVLSKVFKVIIQIILIVV